MSEPVHIDDAIKKAQHEEHHFFDEPEERWFHAGEKVALHRVRSGEIVTDADVKVDQLYRALSSISFDQYCEFCSTLTDEGPHNKDCLFVEAVEYVAKNWKADNER